MSAFDIQIGGNHYKDFKIQPTEFIHKNNLTFLQGCVIKRVCRYNKKGTPVEDLEKCIHEITMLQELHTPFRILKIFKLLPLSTQVSKFVKENKLSAFQHIAILLVCIYTNKKGLEEAKDIIRDEINYIK